MGDGKGLPAPEGSPAWHNLVGKRLQLWVSGTGESDGARCCGWEVESVTAVVRRQRVLTVISDGVQEDELTLRCLALDGSEVAAISAGLEHDVAWLRAAVAEQLGWEGIHVRFVTADGCLLDDG